MSLEQINFPSNLPKCVKWRHKNFVHALLLFLGLFLKLFPLGSPEFDNGKCL